MFERDVGCERTGEVWLMVAGKGLVEEQRELIDLRHVWHQWR